MLVITVSDKERFTLSESGRELGFILVSLKTDGKVRVGLQFPREISIARGEPIKKEETK